MPAGSGQGALRKTYINAVGPIQLEPVLRLGSDWEITLYLHVQDSIGEIFLDRLIVRDIHAGAEVMVMCFGEWGYYPCPGQSQSLVQPSRPFHRESPIHAV